MYFVIRNDDGDTHVDIYDRERLLKQLNEWNEYDYKYIEGIDDICLEKDTGYWSGKRLIIKGDVVVPKPKKVIEAFEID